MEVFRQLKNQLSGPKIVMVTCAKCSTTVCQSNYQTINATFHKAHVLVSSRSFFIIGLESDRVIDG